MVQPVNAKGRMLPTFLMCQLLINLVLKLWKSVNINVYPTTQYFKTFAFGNKLNKCFWPFLTPNILILILYPF